MEPKTAKQTHLESLGLPEAHAKELLALGDGTLITIVEGLLKQYGPTLLNALLPILLANITNPALKAILTGLAGALPTPA